MNGDDPKHFPETLFIHDTLTSWANFEVSDNLKTIVCDVLEAPRCLGYGLE
jgi:hypothetical protein